MLEVGYRTFQYMILSACIGLTAVSGAAGIFFL